MKNIFFVICIILILIVVIKLNHNTGTTKAYNIAKRENTEVVNIETHFTIFDTPFNYVQSGGHIYEIDMSNGDKWWLRNSGFWWDEYKEK